jgi:AsmA protein
MKALKWIGIAVGALIVLIVAALLIIPMFVDLNDYKPEIEKQVTATTGRPFSIGGDIDLSLFPWAGVALSDIRLGNPDGFEEKEMIRLDAFEVRVKLLPLISRKVQVRRFVVEGPRIVLIRQKDGRANWEGFGAKPEQRAKEPAREKEEKKTPAPNAAPGLPIDQLAVGEFVVSGGSIRYVDQKSKTQKEVTDLNLRLTGVSLDRPVPLAFSARVDGKPVSLEGTVGPVGRQPGTGALAFDLVAKALDQVEAAVKGQVIDAATDLRFDVAVNVAPFSPRKILAAAGQPFPVETRDPKVLKKVSLRTRIQGSPQSVSLSDGVFSLDDSTAAFSAQASEFEKPKVSFEMTLDRLDVDRYLPPEKKESGAKDKKKSDKEDKKKDQKPDYAPLRKLVLDGKAKIGELKAAGARMKDIRLTVSARNGVVKIDPLALALYGGSASVALKLDVRSDRPKANLQLGLEQMAINPLLNDLLQKDFLEGLTGAKVALSFAGDDANSILKTLAGEGELLVKDGAIKGVDLAAMARNVQSAFGAARQTEEKPRTDFTELKVPFAVHKGVASTPGTVLKSPFIRLMAAGEADLVDKKIDFKVDPKLVKTIKGQGDTEERSGLSVPILVSGSLSSPKFAPDLEGAVKSKLEEIAPSGGLQDLVPSKKKKKKKGEQPEEPVESLIKALPFGGSSE